MLLLILYYFIVHITFYYVYLINFYNLIYYDDYDYDDNFWNCVYLYHYNQIIPIFYDGNLSLIFLTNSITILASFPFIYEVPSLYSYPWNISKN